MQKYPRTKKGLQKRRDNIDRGYSKHRAGLQFNPANGEPHTEAWLEERRRYGMRRKRTTVSSRMVREG